MIYLVLFQSKEGIFIIGSYCDWHFAKETFDRYKHINGVKTHSIDLTI